MVSNLTRSTSPAGRQSSASTSAAEFFTDQGLIVENTMLHPSRHFYTQTSPHKKTRNQNDYIATKEESPTNCKTEVTILQWIQKCASWRSWFGPLSCMEAKAGSQRKPMNHTLKHLKWKDYDKSKLLSSVKTRKPWHFGHIKRLYCLEKDTIQGTHQEPWREKDQNTQNNMVEQHHRLVKDEDWKATANNWQQNWMEEDSS